MNRSIIKLSFSVVATIMAFSLAPLAHAEDVTFNNSFTGPSSSNTNTASLTNSSNVSVSNNATTNNNFCFNISTGGNSVTNNTKVGNFNIGNIGLDLGLTNNSNSDPIVVGPHLTSTSFSGTNFLTGPNSTNGNSLNTNNTFTSNITRTATISNRFGFDIATGGNTFSGNTSLGNISLGDVNLFLKVNNDANSFGDKGGGGVTPPPPTDGNGGKGGDVVHNTLALFSPTTTAKHEFFPSGGSADLGLAIILALFLLGYLPQWVRRGRLANLLKFDGRPVAGANTLAVDTLAIPKANK